jgi:hypothetical protein
MESILKPTLAMYAAVYAHRGTVRRVWLEAATEEEAMETCVRWNVGLEGLASRPKEEPAHAYDEKTARRLLGGISRTTLYKELTLGRLERVSDTRKVLITRESLERRVGQRPR